MLRFSIFLFLFYTINSFAQNVPEKEHKIDSIQQVIKTAKHDSVIVNAWKDWDNLIYISDPVMDLELNKKVESLCKKNLRKKLNKDEKYFFTKYLAFAYNNFGIIYKNQGDYARSIDYYTESLKLNEKIGQKRGVAGCLGNIGIIYKNQEDYDRAIDYYDRCLKIQIELDDKMGISGTNVNLGMAYSLKKDYVKAIDYYNKGLIIYEEIDSKRGMAIVLNNLGIIFHDMKEYDKALDFHTRGLKYQEEIGNQKGVSASYNNIALVYQQKYNHPKAIEYGKKALLLAKEANAPIEIKDASNTLHSSYKKLGKHKEALEMYELFVTTRDTLESEENKQEVIRQEYKYNYDKQTTKDSLALAKQNEITKAEIDAKNSKLSQQNTEIKAKRNQQYFLFGGLALVLVFAFFMYNRFKITQKQKHIIEEKEKETNQQKHIIEEKHKEITDSINYAKRIQEAILPSRSSLNENLKNGFVYYKPKDIVAGDFYWLEKLDGKIFFAAADCTGHGVPGALVSVVCSNALSKAVLEDKISETGKILDRTRELVIEKFSRSEENVKDGMDVSLVSLVYRTNNQNESEVKLQWSGANNPLWIVKREKGDKGQMTGEEKHSLIEVKPDKQPIGNYADHVPFASHEYSLEKGDTIYIFTDGYQDQFGGDKKKKFKASKMKELFLSIQHLSMDEQKKFIDIEFEKWRGSLEQIDDICVIGVRI